ncbi:hypothetical protein SAMN06265368_0661 [Cohaesibacter gelatinilyticus]|uniref:Uncharacterized protein n=1 Tax=Cohaesibacter gelatinilyticus TaxID=372072 RepID=A0A285NDS9_9HYPH|nr:hypothetical protein SAMN06265368_0661 [Cohaesibacter gelatinilyticus]
MGEGKSQSCEIERLKAFDMLYSVGKGYDSKQQALRSVTSVFCSEEIVRLLFNLTFPKGGTIKL